MKRIYITVSLLILSSCSTDKSPFNEVGVTELEQFETLVSSDDNLVVNPTIVKFDNDDNLLVYDSRRGELLKLNKLSEVVGKYGNRGRGPGEFLRVNNVFHIEDYIYIIDDIGLKIHKFTVDGVYETSLEYKQKAGLTLPPLPPVPAPDLSFLDNLYAVNINNQPIITDFDYVLLPAEQMENTVYKIADFEGNTIMDFGEIPEGSSFELDYNLFRTSISNREVPNLLIHNVFPVKGGSGSGEIFMVYNAIPRIEKYDANGTKIWSKEIGDNPEIDAIKNAFFNTMQEILSITDAVATFRAYTWGVSDKESNLYLATYNSPELPLWIHEFDKNGDLNQRYKLVSEVELLPTFDIDFDNNLFIVITKESEIRTFQF
ncbi:6-bladed beta-propeller [Pleurocapsales cyanobacterium LEGE 10410]|nr:6-bladed beta-propeller [Pleurocapsales cyanobacterium LEGE 10410]